MYYSAIGLLAALILLIENKDILIKPNDAFEKPAWKVYRTFLFAVLAYYATDFLWGVLESNKLATLLFIDTSVYYIAMAAGILLWTQYTVTYLEEPDGFGRVLLYGGRVISALVVLFVAANFFMPVYFTVDSDCVYHPLTVRYVLLASQIVLLLLLSAYAFSAILHKRNVEEKGNRYRTLGLFGLVMAACLTVQLWFPLLPLYSVAYMLGTCLLRSSVIGDEKEAYRLGLEEAAKIEEMKQSLKSLLDNMPGLNFSKDAKTGVYLACNQAFAEYAHKPNPEGVVGLTDAEIFDPVTADHFVEDDRMALSMDDPYIFFEDVPDAAGNQRQFQTTKLKFTDVTGRLCTLGMCQDVTDMVRIQHENATTKEAYERERSTGVIYSHIAQTLARSYIHLFYVDLDTAEFIEYLTDSEPGKLVEARRGVKFFDQCKVEAEMYVYPEDRAAFVKALDRPALLQALSRNNTFLLSYRLMGYHSDQDEPTYVSMRVSRMTDDENHMVIAVSDVDEQVKQRRAAEQAREERIAYARLTALAGDYLCVYVVDPETGKYREYSATAGYDSYGLARDGDDFFDETRKQAQRFNHPEDVGRFLSAFTKENVMAEVKRSGMFALTYRIIMDSKPFYVQMKAALLHEEEGIRLIVGVNDIDASIRQEAEIERRLAQAQREANRDALTGVKSRHAYLDTEEQLNRQIAEHCLPEFAIAIMDVNDLKKVNDTTGHKAGDQYLRDACKIICNVFKHSPVFRVGGDEFAVIARNEDYLRIEELLGKMKDRNTDAIRSGGIVIACGMAKYENDASVAPVFERADRNMYEDKNRLKAEQENN